MNQTEIKAIGEAFLERLASNPVIMDLVNRNQKDSGVIKEEKIDKNRDYMILERDGLRYTSVKGMLDLPLHELKTEALNLLSSIGIIQIEEIKPETPVERTFGIAIKSKKDNVLIAFERVTISVEEDQIETHLKGITETMFKSLAKKISQQINESSLLVNFYAPATEDIVISMLARTYTVTVNEVVPEDLLSQKIMEDLMF